MHARHARRQPCQHTTLLKGKGIEGKKKRNDKSYSDGIIRPVNKKTVLDAKYISKHALFVKGSYNTENPI